MYEKFLKLLEERDITPYRVATDTGIPQSTFSDWKAGRSMPGAEKIYKLAKYFGVPMEYFMEP